MLCCSIIKSGGTVLSLCEIRNKCTLDVFSLCLFLSILLSTYLPAECYNTSLPLSQAYSFLVSQGWLFSNWCSARGHGCYGNLQGVLVRVGPGAGGGWVRVGRGHPLKKTEGSSYPRLGSHFKKWTGCWCASLFVQKPSQSECRLTTSNICWRIDA